MSISVDRRQTVLLIVPDMTLSIKINVDTGRGTRLVVTNNRPAQEVV